MPYAPFAQTRPEEYDLFTEEANNHKVIILCVHESLCVMSLYVYLRACA